SPVELWMTSEVKFRTLGRPSSMNISFPAYVSSVAMCWYRVSGFYTPHPSDHPKDPQAARRSEATARGPWTWKRWCEVAKRNARTRDKTPSVELHLRWNEVVMVRP